MIDSPRSLLSYFYRLKCHLYRPNGESESKLNVYFDKS